MLKLGPLAFLRRLRPDPARKVTFRIASENRFIKKASSRILNGIAPLGVPEEKVFDIKLCIEEAVRNAIVHGNHSDPKKGVRIAFRVEANELHIEVEDEGEGFDHNQLPDPTHQTNILKNSGRGVYLIKKLMDRVDYNAAGNAIIMVKKLT